jgi:hypothetical protein
MNSDVGLLVEPLPHLAMHKLEVISRRQKPVGSRECRNGRLQFRIQDSELPRRVLSITEGG